MAGPYPLATLAPTISATGITAPSFADILASLIASYQLVYGADTTLDPSTQDGQWIAIQSLAIYNNNQSIVAVYLGYSPTYAQGTNLSSLVKINGLRRDEPGNSTAPANVVGVAGTTIAAGIVQDGFGNQWALAANTVIPYGGEVTATLTCQVPGAISLPEGSTTVGTGGGLSFVNPQQGWQSVTTTSDAAQGAPVEDDPDLRQRQSISTGLPAQTPMQSILAAVANLPDVEAYAIYQNDTNETNGLGIPAHYVAVVVLGGDATEIAATIAAKKSEGTGTYGTTTVVVIDPSGVPDTINFYVLTQSQIYYVVALNPLTGYLATTGALVLAAIATAISNLPIGQNVEYNKLFSAANLSGTAAVQASTNLGNTLSQAQLDQLSSTYEITAFYIGTAPIASSPVSFTNSSATIGWVANALAAGDVVVFSVINGNLPVNFEPDQEYFVLASGLTSSHFEVAATLGGAAIVAGSAGTGTPTAYSNVADVDIPILFYEEAVSSVSNGTLYP